MTKRRSSGSDDVDPYGRSTFSRLAFWCTIVVIAIVVFGSGILYAHLVLPDREPRFELPTSPQPTALWLGG